VAVVPTSHTFTDGVKSSSEDNTYIRDPIAFLQRPPLAELRQTAAQLIANTTYVAVSFDAEDVDTDVDNIGGHDNVTNNSRYTARYAGWYQVSGVIGYVANATGRRLAAWAVNGTNVNAGQVAINNTGAATDVEVVARKKHLYLNVGDYLQLMAYQESGIALNTASAAAGVVQANMSVRWVSL
jgi:hypothetical protein